MKKIIAELIYQLLVEVLGQALTRLAEWLSAMPLA